MAKAALIALLESILSRTPANQAFCIPLKRSTVVALLRVLKGESDEN
jgi:hypothetical protein